MAQNAVGRLFRCQSCFRQSWTSFTQARSYSKNAIPTFPPTSSPELDQALNRFRQELFIPFGLGEKQRRLMFRQRYAHKLEEEPVTVTVGEDEKFQLRPMDPQSRPRKEEIVDVVKLMKTTKDWQNIIPFLTALRMSRRYLKLSRWEWLVRKAGEANALGIILECAKQAERTGLQLKHVDLVHRLFFALHLKAQAAEFQGEATAKALSLARQAVMLMEAPEHVNHDIQWDPKRRPSLIGVLLELSAARALNEFQGDDADGHVRAYAQRLLATWPLGSFEEEPKKWHRVDRLLQENVPIWNGIRLALQVHGIAADKALATSLKARLGELSKLIAKHQSLAPEKIQQQPSVGYKQAQLLFQN
ncbi:hypothetical protein VTN77DRAFT_2715 [Rasamsonia byssochlamydoides]|uniref:uncharacterized protein n=1 Tax=Rasamsonia byssochlamydoides TaxID=89139 RepID=UPI003743C555